MSGNLKWLFRLTAYLGIVVLSPLLGAWLSQQPLTPLLNFPPKPLPSYPITFSWAVCVLMTIFITICLLPFLSRNIRSHKQLLSKQTAKPPFPYWGWLGIGLMILSWVMAWNRFDWFEPLQPFTFSPLWLSYILIVNAVSYRYSHHCLLLDHTKQYLSLFLISAILWWSFEYLNVFVRNWYYVGVNDLSPFRYFIFATLPFATVLPAVLGTAELLNCFPKVSAGLDRFKPVALPGLKNLSIALMVISSLGLAALALWPDKLFFLTWLLPVTLVAGLQSFTEKPGLLLDIETGDWRRIWVLSIAGLICGIFWEMWNFYSFAHWQYSVPFIQRFKIFEMPLLGYAGYLPFGIFCGLFSDYILANSPLMQLSEYKNANRNS